jgi:hypothetical protein
MRSQTSIAKMQTVKQCTLAAIVLIVLRAVVDVPTVVEAAGTDVVAAVDVGVDLVAVATVAAEIAAEAAATTKLRTAPHGCSWSHGKTKSEMQPKAASLFCDCPSPDIWLSKTRTANRLSVGRASGSVNLSYAAVPAP